MSEYMIACTSWLEEMTRLSESERGRLFTALLKEARGENEEPRGTERVLYHKFVQDAHDAQYIYKSKDNLSQVSSRHSNNTNTAALFDSFWSAYPAKHRVNKKRCVQIWEKLKPSAELVEQMLDSIEAWKQSRQWKQGFVPNPDTWLRGEKWNDATPDPWNGDAQTRSNPALAYEQKPISKTDFDALVVNLGDL